MDKYKYNNGDVRKVYDAGYNDGRYEKDYDPLSHYLVCDVIEHVETPRTVDTPCIRDMCCNQFGERDEIQAIIDKLREDVVERDERIEALEQTLQQVVDERNGAWFEVEELNTKLNRLREHE